MLTAGVYGACGRMGQAVIRVLRERGHILGAAFEDEASPHIGKDAGTQAGTGGVDVKISAINNNEALSVDGFIDFSTPGASKRLLTIAEELKKPVVIGTTGFSDSERKMIEKASKNIPVLLSPNMSLGVNLLFKLTEIAAGILKDDYDIEIFEAHHRFKKDAPSGTAKKLLEIIKSASPGKGKAKEVHDRSGRNEARGADEIGIMTLRGGDILGDHTVFFAGMGERLELTHRVSSRETLARGAVTALEFLVEKDRGLYNMFDVLRL